MKKRVMVDMSATLIHHGHIRLLKKASKYGDVIVGLTTDEEIKKKKGYDPELSFDERKEILESIKYVKEVVPTPWLIDEAVLEKYNIDLLVHGHDNSNQVSEDKLIIFPRTEGISSTILRERVMKAYAQKKSQNILLTPGPATTTYSVKLAQIVDDICPREKEFGDVMKWISQELTSIVADNKKYVTVLFGGSGTAAVESILTSVIPEDKKVLIINNGAYGERMCQISNRYGINFSEFKSSPIQPIDFNKLEEVIKKEENLSHLAVVHNETTTGLLNDLNKIGELAEKYNLDLIVDAMSSYGAIPIDMEKQNIKYLAASSNKNLQGMAGVSFVIAKKEALEKLKNVKPKSFYLSLYEQYNFFEKHNQTRFTPPVQTMYALKQAIVELKEEGVENRYKRYSKSWETLTQGLKKLGLQYVVDDKHHSKIITSILLPENLDFDDLHDYFYEKGFTIYPGKVKDLNTFRIANIGDIDYRDIERFLELFAEYLNHKD